MSAGRPTKYKEEYNQQAERLCRLGAIDADLAEFFEVNEDTINEWKKVHPLFSESISRGKKEADLNVGDKLYDLCLGFHYEEETEAKGEEGGKVTYKNKRYNVPDFRAIRFWLMNRQPKKWREKQDIDHTTQGDKIEAVTIFKLPDNGRDA